MGTYEVLFLLKAKGRVTRNNLRLSFHLDEKEIEKLLVAGLIKCVHKKENWMDDDYYEISAIGLKYLEENRK